MAIWLTRRNTPFGVVPNSSAGRRNESTSASPNEVSLVSRCRSGVPRNEAGEWIFTLLLAWILGETTRQISSVPSYSSGMEARVPGNVKVFVPENNDHPSSVRRNALLFSLFVFFRMMQRSWKRPTEFSISTVPVCKFRCSTISIFVVHDVSTNPDNWEPRSSLYTGNSYVYL